MEFKWTDELVKEFGDWCNQAGWHKFSGAKEVSKLLEEFKKSKGKKEYEILSFVSPYAGVNNVFFKKTEDGDFAPSCTITIASNYTETYLLLQPTAKIHSVKRLSDGEVFTVGDKVKEGAIQSFRLNYGGNQLWISTNDAQDEGSCLEYAEKQPTYLFKTEDGKDVFDGDKVFMLHTVTWRTSPDVQAPKNPFTDGGTIKYFSTQEAAQVYVLLNKPLLSVKDITDYFDTWPVSPKDYSSYAIIQLAKSKTKNT